MNNNTILVTGIHGLVGQYLFRLLKQWPGTVVISGRGPLRMPASSFIYEEMDITEEQQVRRIISKHQPAVVIHSAAMAQPDECELEPEKAERHNVAATRFLLEASSAHGSFFIFLSTDFIFSGENGPYDEESTPDPVNVYGHTKWRAEQQVLRYDYGFAIVRTVLVYGNVISGTRSNMISWAKGALEKGNPIKVVSDQLRTTTFAGDLAKAILTIAQGKAQGIWHISGKDALSPWDMALRVADYLQLDASIMTSVDASVFSQPARRPLKTPFSIEKARKELGYEPVSFEEGMRIVLNGG